MTVNLAGFNVDLENIKAIKTFCENGINKEEIQKLNWTPETISASYARISRDERPIDQLREQARTEIDKARRSNSAIIFEMGHSSIAEHATFNLDIIGVSRYLSEQIEKSRLASFTEKSQRYIKIGTDYYIPSEFDESTKTRYVKTVEYLFDTYNKLHEMLVPYFEAKNPDLKQGDKGYRDLVNLAKEDARYVLPLCCHTQLGMTANARTLEGLLKKLSMLPTAEAQALSEAIQNVLEGYAPSLIKYTKASPYQAGLYNAIGDLLDKKHSMSYDGNNDPAMVAACLRQEYAYQGIQLLDWDKDGLDKVLAAFIVKCSDIDYKEALARAKKTNDATRQQIFDRLFDLLDQHDSVGREFEMCDFTFGIQLSASAFAQLKRHRMATIIDSDYVPAIGCIVPDSVSEVGGKETFLHAVEEADAFYYDTYRQYPVINEYILTNSHIKNVMLRCNFRELVHISRLRSDGHAQWEIREISDKMCETVGKELPMLKKFLSGKDKFKK